MSRVECTAAIGIKTLCKKNQFFSLHITGRNHIKKTSVFSNISTRLFSLKTMSEPFNIIEPCRKIYKAKKMLKKSSASRIHDMFWSGYID